MLSVFGVSSFCVLREIAKNDKVYFLTLGVSELENSAVFTDKAPPGVCLCVHAYCIVFHLCSQFCYPQCAHHHLYDWLLLTAFSYLSSACHHMCVL